MKATPLTWVLSLLFAGAAVAYSVEGVITADSVKCLGCPCSDCWREQNVTYYKGEVSTVHLCVSDLYSRMRDIGGLPYVYHQEQ